jgi:acyl dehydratase
MSFGRYYEEFEVRAIYKHWPGRTINEYDNALFALLSMNHSPLFIDDHFACSQPLAVCPTENRSDGTLRERFLWSAR